MITRFTPKLKKHGKSSPAEFITVVSGLPRSGTSMMMKMLEAGGLPLLIDQIRTPDENNPNGYYEFEKVKKLKEGDNQWVAEARGKAFKVISALLEYLPPQYPYKIIFLRRNLAEILASQTQMLVKRGETVGKVSDEKLTQMYQQHLCQVEDWLLKQPNMAVLYVSYNKLLVEPAEEIVHINHFLGVNLDTRKMTLVVDQSLYRQRIEK